MRPRKTPPGIQIHPPRANNTRPKPQLMPKVKHQHNRHREHFEEEILYNCRRRGICWRVTYTHRRDGCPKLRYNDEDVGCQCNVGANHARLGAERELFEAVACHGPGAAEADMAEADAAPCEEAGEAANGDEPVKDFGLRFEVDEVCEEADSECAED